jgi:hypothetical protein
MVVVTNLTPGSANPKSRFRASVYGVAAMRQAFEDVIFDFENEFPGPGFKGWNVYNLSWAHNLDTSFDRPGYPAHSFMYAKAGLYKLNAVGPLA